MALVINPATGNFDLTGTGSGPVVPPSITEWSPTVTYSVGEFVTYNGELYRSSVAGNLNNQPDVSPTEWEVYTATSVEFYDDFTPPADSQTIFTLSNLPTDVLQTRMFINGQKQKLNTDYIIAGTTLTFISTDYTIRTSDLVEVYYQ